MKRRKSKKYILFITIYIKKIEIIINYYTNYNGQNK